jgi:hypothetical protein
MTSKVTLHDRSVSDILDIVHTLKSQGMVLGVDFDFAYSPPEYDGFTGIETARKCDFTFYTDSLATAFALQWH